MYYIRPSMILNIISVAQGREGGINLHNVVSFVRRSVMGQYPLKVADINLVIGTRPHLRTQPLQSCLRYPNELSSGSGRPWSNPLKDGPRLSNRAPIILALAHEVPFAQATRRQLALVGSGYGRDAGPVRYGGWGLTRI